MNVSAILHSVAKVIGSIFAINEIRLRTHSSQMIEMIPSVEWDY